MDRGAWRATVHVVAKSQTQPSDFDFALGFPNRKPSKRVSVRAGSHGLP